MDVGFCVSRSVVPCATEMHLSCYFGIVGHDQKDLCMLAREVRAMLSNTYLFRSNFVVLVNIFTIQHICD